MEATVRGVKLYYEANLEGRGEVIPVLFLHGWGCTHSFFQTIYHKLSLPYIAVDFPAHGLSAEPPAPWHVSDFAEQILALLDELKVDRVSVVAHSFGGRVAILLAAGHPERIARMVFTGAAGIRKPQSEEAAKKTSRYKAIQAALNKVKKVPLLEEPVNGLQKNLQQKYASPDYLALSDSMKETFKNIVNEDLSPYLSQISAPTLLIWGTEDTETPLWMGEKMQSEMKDAALIPFEGRSHFAFLEEPQRFLLISEPFLKGAASC